MTERIVSMPAELARLVAERTPARLFSGRAGAAYRTNTQLELRADHAAARDAVLREFDLARDFPAEFIAHWNLFQAATKARDKAHYLLYPRLGRELDEAARQEISRRCAPGADLQIVIGDGLSASAVTVQVPKLLPLIVAAAESRKWKVGSPFVIRYCRVGVMNAVGDLLRPTVVVLLIGERPGMSTAESLSAYLGWRPQSGHTDADRNLISNIHARGVPVEASAARIVSLAAELMRARRSGTEVRAAAPFPLPPST